MIARLRIVEGKVQPSNQPQVVQKVIIGSLATTLTVSSATETTIGDNTALEGEATDSRGGTWQFLLFPEPELRWIGVVYTNNHPRPLVLAELAKYRKEAERQAIGACCL